MKRVVTIQDISCVGKCSLTVALPILSAMGLETAILPTAVLSTHTMFQNPVFIDLTDQIEPIAAHWEKEGFDFSSIYTGYLGSIRQIDLVSRLFEQFKTKDTLIFVDPVMADNGKLYPGFDPAFASKMRELCSKADIIVPNLTEASFLTGIPYQETQDEAWLEALLSELSKLGPRYVILTGYRPAPGRIGILGKDCKKDKVFSCDTEELPVSYHGTGDIFSSTALGALENGLPLPEALQIACSYVKDTIEATMSNPNSRSYGVDFETTLSELAQKIEKIHRQ